ncbi:DUF1499 domain-containing protein [Meridianimarinicoccus roseus]|uniref:DUF1499 domain-containing protein n=1 Tax=Meridianimarinicoccus roseus TaxID=2072018 RepID=A0A2V2LND9_9RHOB|nr:DUF1499 domain-containing protein [Meridianimarinicoccus roseus]PWR03223.1 DUF1499 domain-containing protein [Meridianimarinicoccus roseus]
MRRVLLGLEIVLGVLILAALVFGAYVRLAPSDPARWHVDPLEVAQPGYPGYYLMRPSGGSSTGPVFDMAPADLLAAFDRVARSEPRVSVLAGSVDEGQVTYVARSALWGFPDYISVRAVPADEGGARLAVFSRLRFGQSDLGVNRARIEDWIGRLRAGGA